MPSVVLTGQASQLNVGELEDYEDSPAPAPAADSPFISPLANDFMLFLQAASQSRRPDSYPGWRAYGGVAHNRSPANGSDSPDAPDSPASSSNPSSAPSLPAEHDSWPGSPRRRSPPSPSYTPTSPSYVLPAYPSGGFPHAALQYLQSAVTHMAPCLDCRDVGCLWLGFPSYTKSTTASVFCHSRLVI